MRADGAVVSRGRWCHSMGRMHLALRSACRLCNDGIFKGSDLDRQIAIAATFAHSGLDDEAAEVPSRRCRRRRVGRQPARGTKCCTPDVQCFSLVSKTHLRLSISSFRILISSA